MTYSFHHWKSMSSILCTHFAHSPHPFKVTNYLQIAKFTVSFHYSSYCVSFDMVEISIYCASSSLRPLTSVQGTQSFNLFPSLYLFSKWSHLVPWPFILPIDIVLMFRISRLRSNINFLMEHLQILLADVNHYSSKWLFHLFVLLVPHFLPFYFIVCL